MYDRAKLICHDKRRDRERWRIETNIDRLKDLRLVAASDDRLARNFRRKFERANIPHSTRAISSGIRSLFSGVRSVIRFPSLGSDPRSAVQSISGPNADRCPPAHHNTTRRPSWRRRQPKWPRESSGTCEPQKIPASDIK